MSRVSLFFVACFLLVALLAGYISGIYFQLFWTVWWYDVVLHVMGGLGLGLAFGASIVVRRDTLHMVLVKVFVPVICAAFVWEYIEFQRHAFYAADYVLDTLSDLMFGLAGGLIAVLITQISAQRHG